MQCFTPDGTPLRTHRQNDLSRSLHERLGWFSQKHFILIGLYYAKWSEKLHFYFAKMRQQKRSLSTASRSRTPLPASAPAPAQSPSPSKSKRSLEVAPSSAAAFSSVSLSEKEVKRNLEELKEKRAAIFCERSDRQLTKKDKAVFWYRENRRLKWKAADTMLSESK